MFDDFRRGPQLMGLFRYHYLVGSRSGTNFLQITIHVLCLAKYTM